MRPNTSAWAAVTAFSILFVSACGTDEGSKLACGPGTAEQDGLCVPLDATRSDASVPKDAAVGLVCGAGTLAVDGVCVASDTDADGGEVTCGPGTSLVDGRCAASDAGFECGAGTMAQDGTCVPIPAPSCESLGNCPPVPPVCDEVAEDPTATLQDFSGFSADPCAAQPSGTPFECSRYGNDYEVRSPSVFDGAPPGPAHFLRLAKTPGLDTEYDHNSIAFKRTATGAHASVVADFDFRITSRRGLRGNGFGFALLNTAHHGTEGAIANDAAEEPNFQDAVGVGFDIFANDEYQDIGEPNIRPDFANAISIHYGDADPVPEDPALEQEDFTPYGDLASGLWHHARITVRDGMAGLTVSVAITLPCGQIIAIVPGTEIPGAHAYEARAWLGARSGDEAADYDFANVRVQYLDAAARGVAFETNQARVSEAGGAAVLTVVRSGDLSQPGSATYVTRDLTAKAGLDYTTSCGRVSFAAGQARKTIEVPVLDDALDETSFDSALGFHELVPNPAASFGVRLVHADATTHVLGPADATVTIMDDESAKQHGEWGALECSGIVGIHASLLSTGKVLLADRLDQVALWTASGGATPIAGPGHNLFCSGAAFLADGRLLIAGGHGDLHGAPAADGMGLAELVAFNPNTEAWQMLPEMNDGRWYPTVTTLSSGNALVISGGITVENEVFLYNLLPQVYLPGTEVQPGAYRDLSGAAADPNNEDAHGTEFYPWMFAVPGNKAFKAGPDHTTWMLDTTATGAWTAGPDTLWEEVRDYGSAVFLGEPTRKDVLILGGGDPPTRAVERLDLQAYADDPDTQWELQAPLIAARRQHNATVLPDGRVFVTNGTGGAGFNDLDNAVTAGEMYQNGQWFLLPAAAVPRGYHSFGLLLPDGSVLTGGGGEGGNVAVFQSNLQIYYPDYFFKPRPVIDTAPAAVAFGSVFSILTHAEIEKVTIVRLGTPTHSFDENQRFMELDSNAIPGGVSTVVPNDGWVPPGHYLLFIIDADGVPSQGKLLRVGSGP